MVQYGAELARSHGVKNLEYRLGDLEELPLARVKWIWRFFTKACTHAIHPKRRWRKLGGSSGPVVTSSFSIFQTWFRAGARFVCGRVARLFKRLNCTISWVRRDLSLFDVAVVPSDQADPHFETVLSGS
jgi:ArsR family transcriptional regulator